jgi:uracil-DNA glycosylase
MSIVPLQRRLDEHVALLRGCSQCPKMHRPAVSGGAIVSKIMTVGQAPGSKEPVMARPFAWTAGKTLFRWFEGACGISEPEFRSSVYMAAVCRCFPGRNGSGGDRVPGAEEIAACARWLENELTILRPTLVIPIGKLAIQQFLPVEKLTAVIGKRFVTNKYGHRFDLIALPHPSGASPWHRIEPGKGLLERALRLIVAHPAWRAATFKRVGVN